MLGDAMDQSAPLFHEAKETGSQKGGADSAKPGLKVDQAPGPRLWSASRCPPSPRVSPRRLPPPPTCLPSGRPGLPGADLLEEPWHLFIGIYISI